MWRGRFRHAAAPECAAARWSRSRSPPAPSARSLARGHTVGGLGVHLDAAWRSTTLDRKLAEGLDAQSSAVLALRARKLTGHRGRQRVADGLAGAICRAQDTTPGLTAAVRPDARELLDARTVLTALQRRLRGCDAVTAQGVALVQTLLTDAASPLYRPSGPGELASRLRAAAAALELQTTRQGIRRDGTREGRPPHPVPERHYVAERRSSCREVVDE